MTRPQPPYLRIVDAIRGRITSGDLRPGDPVPSARRITQDWGVAIATATKVLAELRQQGLVTAVPGIGTIVAGQAPAAPGAHATGMLTTGAPRAARSAETELTRERIVRAAVEIADAEGMPELSMRRIATALGVATMSLYRHVPGKDDLVLFMIDAAIGEIALPDPPPEGWRVRLEVATRLMWKAFRRHPWLAQAMSLTRPQLAPNALAYANWVLDALEELGLDVSDRMYVHVTLFSYTRGVATSLELETEAERDTGLTDDEWMQTQEPTLLALASDSALATIIHMTKHTGFDFDLDKLFEFGLARLLDGMEAHFRR
jgi:AcrR family transcriptional regulator